MLFFYILFGVHVNATFLVRLVTNPVLFLFETHCTFIITNIFALF